MSSKKTTISSQYVWYRRTVELLKYLAAGAVIVIVGTAIAGQFLPFELALKTCLISVATSFISAGLWKLAKYVYHLLKRNSLKGRTSSVTLPSPKE